MHWFRPPFASFFMSDFSMFSCVDNNFEHSVTTSQHFMHQQFIISFTAHVVLLVLLVPKFNSSVQLRILFFHLCIAFVEISVQLIVDNLVFFESLWKCNFFSKLFRSLYTGNIRCWMLCCFLHSKHHFKLLHLYLKLLQRFLKIIMYYS